MSVHMDRELIALRDGKYNEAIQLASERLDAEPEHISSHFTLVQANEAIGEFELALKHAIECLKNMPDSFEALYLAATCASKIKSYDIAYKYAALALKDDRNPNLPKTINVIFKVLSYIPGFKSLRGTNETIVGVYSTQTQWLRDYVTWYENKST